MHDIRWIRDNATAFDKALARRGLEPLAEHLISIDELRRARIRVFETHQARRNAASKEIGDAKKAKDDAKANALMAEVADIKRSMATLEDEVKQSETDLRNALASIPNLPLSAPEVPDGKDEHGNVLHHQFFPKRGHQLPFAPKPHFDLGEALKQMDFETAAKLSGARFVVLKSGLARLERAIGQFMLDLHTNEHGYMEVNPPLLVRDDAMFGTAQLPKFEEDQFAATNTVFLKEAANRYLRNLDSEIKARLIEAREREPENPVIDFNDRAFITMTLQFANEAAAKDSRHWLIPTAEVPLTNLVRESILDEKELPMRLTALTPCFRAEAGAAGKDTRGMIRQHQFTKVELVSITTPETSKDEHDRMLSCAEEVLKRLDLHYRVMTLCTGDMGFASQKTYDIEVWMPGQGEGGAYREISSCSVCGDFQARRMDARYRGPDNKPRFVHTLNGSGTAVGRALIAVIENYQQEDGSIAVPTALQPYMGGIKTIEGSKN